MTISMKTPLHGTVRYSFFAQPRLFDRKKKLIEFVSLAFKYSRLISTTMFNDQFRIENVFNCRKWECTVRHKSIQFHGISTLLRCIQAIIIIVDCTRVARIHSIAPISLYISSFHFGHLFRIMSLCRRRSHTGKLQKFQIDSTKGSQMQ